MSQLESIRLSSHTSGYVGRRYQKVLENRCLLDLANVHDEVIAHEWYQTLSFMGLYNRYLLLVCFKAEYSQALEVTRRIRFASHTIPNFGHA